MLALKLLWWESEEGLQPGHAFDHNACDFNAFDTDAIPANVFGGAPRPFFSYSHKRLAWSERPLVPRIVEPGQPPAITGIVATAHSGGHVFAFGTVGFPGTVQTKHAARQRVEIRGVYVPPAVSGTGHTIRRFGPSVRAEGEMFDWDLLAEALMADAA